MSKSSPSSAAQEWLLFLPQLPSSPSSLRVQVWRRTRAAGAVGLQGGVIALPRAAEHEQFLRGLLADLERQGGSGVIFVAAPLDATYSETLIARFRDERDQEYAEFSERAQEFLDELDKESRSTKFTFAELEENEHDLRRLDGWLQKIQARDYFGGNQAEAAVRALARCKEALDVFTHEVYTSEGLSDDDATKAKDLPHTLADPQ
jgi:ChrB-like protein